MDADRFVEIVRSGADKLRVDDLVLIAGEQRIHGKGKMRIESGTIELAMTIAPSEQAPAFASGAQAKSDCWAVSGVIEDHLHFKCDYVWPCFPSKHWTPAKATTVLTFELHPVELTPSCLDAMSTQERADLVKQALQQQGRLAEAQAQSQKHQEEVPAAQPASVVFRAVMMEYPLRPVMWKAKKSKTCQFRDGQADDDRLSCDGDIGNFEFSLEDQKKGQDLCVTLTSKKEYNSPGVEADWRMFHAFMNALAFAIGANAWPYRIEYWRYGRKLTDRVTSARRLARTRHAPFTDRLAFNAAIGQVEWAFEDTLKKAVSFFESESTLSKEVAQILFLFRQAGDKSVHGGVAIIAFCALLENLVQIVFKERNLDRAKTEDGTAAETFQRAKAEVLAFIEQQMSGNNAGFSRLQGIVQAAGAKNTEQIFKIVVRHLGLRWEEDMKSMFTTWKRNRNGLFHKKERASESEAELKDSMLNQSRIAGAINILVLRLIGYSGPMQSSAFEGAYKRV